jgi:hypothetical protein
MGHTCEGPTDAPVAPPPVASGESSTTTGNTGVNDGESSSTTVNAGDDDGEVPSLIIGLAIAGCVVVTIVIAVVVARGRNRPAEAADALDKARSRATANPIYSLGIGGGDSLAADVGAFKQRRGTSQTHISMGANDLCAQTPGGGSDATHDGVTGFGADDASYTDIAPAPASDGVGLYNEIPVSLSGGSDANDAEAEC